MNTRELIIDSLVSYRVPNTCEIYDRVNILAFNELCNDKIYSLDEVNAMSEEDIKIIFDKIINYISGVDDLGLYIIILYGKIPITLYNRFVNICNDLHKSMVDRCLELAREIVKLRMIV